MKKLDPSRSLLKASLITNQMPTILRLNLGIVSKTPQFNHFTYDKDFKTGAIRNLNLNTRISITMYPSSKFHYSGLHRFQYSDDLVTAIALNLV